MKTVTLVYCGQDAHAGKALALPLRTGGNCAFLRDAGMFEGEIERCDRVVIMPDVSGARRKMIERAYPGKWDVVVTVTTDVPRLYAKHRGRGRFYLMRGEEIVSGPHSKDEAKRLAA